MARSTILALTSTLLAGTGVALAQQESSSSGASATTQVEEVTITAERTTSTVQRTPLAITVFRGEDLERQGVNDVSALTGKVPNVNISNKNGTMAVNVRGVGTNQDNQSAEPAVNINIDGIYLSRAAGAVGAFYDIERIEVLRGPQGTLYGRNSTGGSINIITRKPTQELQGQAEIEIGNYSLFRTFGMLNVPVVDGKVAVRAAVQTEKHDGYTNNSPATDYNDADNVSGRMHALFTPTDNVSLLLSADYARFRGAGPNQVVRLNTYDVPFDTDGRRDTPLYGYSAQLDWHLEPVTITYQGAYRHFHRDHVLDSDSTYTESTRDPYHVWDWENATWSHEIRAASAPQARLKWVAGAFHFREEHDYRFTSNNSSAVTDSVSFENPDSGGESYAVFGQASYQLTDAFALTGGLRYTHDEKYENGLTRIVFADGRQSVVTNIADLQWSNTSGRVGVEWNLGSSSLVYANVSNGYKAGGFFSGINNHYRPEELTAYETGWKQRFLDNTLQVNTAAFYYDYKDFQAGHLAIVQGANVPATSNAEEARVFGAEIESVYRFSPASRLELNVSYLDAKFEEFVLPGSPPLDLSGLSMPRSPRWSANAGYSHTWGLSGGATVVWDIRTNYQGGTWQEFRHRPNSFQSAYTRSDTSVTFQTSSQRWFLSAYVRNLEGDPIASNAYTASSGAILVDLLPPRTYGMRFGAKL